MKKTKKPRKTTTRHKRKTRHLRKSKRNFRLRNQKGGGPSDAYLLFVINCVRRYNRLTQYFNEGFETMEDYIYSRENSTEFQIWSDFKQLFENQNEMFRLFSMMHEELDKYKFGFVLNGFEEYTQDEASEVARNINEQIGRIPSPGIVPVKETVAIERLFGDKNVKPLNNLYVGEMQKYCEILTKAENLFLRLQPEIPPLPSKARVTKNI